MPDGVNEYGSRFLASPPFYPLSYCSIFQPLMSAQTGFSIVAQQPSGLTTDHLSSCCLIQHTEDLSTMRVRPGSIPAVNK